MPRRTPLRDQGNGSDYVLHINWQHRKCLNWLSFKLMKWIWLFQNEINIIGVTAKKKKCSSVLIDKLNFCVNAFIMLVFIIWLWGSCHKHLQARKIFFIHFSVYFSYYKSGNLKINEINISLCRCLSLWISVCLAIRKWIQSFHRHVLMSTDAAFKYN